MFVSIVMIFYHHFSWHLGTFFNQTRSGSSSAGKKMWTHLWAKSAKKETILAWDGSQAKMELLSTMGPPISLNQIGYGKHAVQRLVWVADHCTDFTKSRKSFMGKKRSLLPTFHTWFCDLHTRAPNRKPIPLTHTQTHMMKTFVVAQVNMLNFYSMKEKQLANP